jgi:hypothetical protein
VIAVHAFTQESQPHDAVQKLEDLEVAMKSKEPSSIDSAVEAAALFSCLCGRQPRALQICVRMLERAAKQASTSASDAQCAVVYCKLGHALVLQGSMHGSLFRSPSTTELQLQQTADRDLAMGDISKVFGDVSISDQTVNSKANETNGVDYNQKSQQRSSKSLSNGVDKGGLEVKYLQFVTF